MRTIVALLGALATIVSAGEAHALCKSPAATTFPLASDLPPDPVLYRVVPRYQDKPVQITGADGAAVAYTARELLVTENLRLLELRVDAQHGTITVEGSDFVPAQTYQIGAWLRPVAPVVGQVAWQEDKWTCSYTRGVAIAMRAPGVAAFRLRWSDGVEAIVPPSTKALFSRYRAAPDPTAGDVMLGHANCLGDLIPPTHRGRPDLTLWALYPDGSSRRVPLGLPDVPAPPAPAVAAPPAVAPPPAAARGSAPEGRGPGVWLLRAGGGIAAGSLLLVLMRARRRRRRSWVV